MSSPASGGERCTWCGAAVGAGQGLRASAPAAGGRAVFCRLEHVVPWAIRGAAWEAGGDGGEAGATECAWCAAPLGADAVLLVALRGEHRVRDGFCDVAHLLAWAKAGGRYRR